MIILASKMKPQQHNFVANNCQNALYIFKMRTTIQILQIQNKT